MALTAHNLHKLKNQHRDGSPPDLVTAFVIQQQVLHKHSSDGWRPQISGNSGELRGANHTGKPRQSLELCGRRLHAHDSLDAFAGSPEPYSAQEIETEQANGNHPRPPPCNTASIHHRKHRRESKSDTSLIQYAERDPATTDSINAGRGAGNNDLGENSGEESEWVENKQYEHVDGRRTKNFEKRARHKMLKATKKRQRNKSSKKVQPANEAPKKKRKGNGEVVARGKSDTLIKGFSAETIAKQRITLQPSHKLGIFKNGRASSPVRRRGLPDLTFSEVDFLSKRSHRSPEARDSNEARSSHGAIKYKSPRKNSFVPPVTTTVSRTTDRPNSAIRSSQGSLNFDPDDHSEYSLHGMQTRHPVDDDSSENPTIVTTSASGIRLQEKSQHPNEKSDASSGLGPHEDLGPTLSPQGARKRARRPTPTALDELLRICDELPAAENAPGKKPINVVLSDQYLHWGVQSSGAIPQYIDHNENNHLPGHHAPAEFVGNASGIHAEAYRAPPLGYSEYDHNFFSRGYRDLDEPPARRTATDETWCNRDADVEGDFMYDHSDSIHHPDVNSFQDSDYQYNQEIAPEYCSLDDVRRWPNTNHDCYPYNAAASLQDFTGTTYISGVYAGHPGAFTRPKLFLREDS